MSFNLIAEVFQHVGRNGTGLVRLNLPEDNSLPGTVTSFVPNENATMTGLDLLSATLGLD